MLYRFSIIQSQFSAQSSVALYCFVLFHYAATVFFVPLYYILNILLFLWLPRLSLFTGQKKPFQRCCPICSNVISVRRHFCNCGHSFIDEKRKGDVEREEKYKEMGRRAAKHQNLCRSFKAMKKSVSISCILLFLQLELYHIVLISILLGFKLSHK